MTSSRIRKAGAEVKTVDATGGNFFTNVWDNSVAGKTGVLLNGMIQGPDYNNHIGRKAHMRSLLFRWCIHPTANTDTNALEGTPLRLLIVYDKQTNGVTATSGDILQAPSNWTTFITGAGVANSLPIEPMNLNNRDRFKILMDKKVTWNHVDRPVIEGEKFIKLKNKEIIWQTAGATVGAIATGSIIFMAISAADGIASNTNELRCEYSSRIRFMDS